MSVQGTSSSGPKRVQPSEIKPPVAPPQAAAAAAPAAPAAPPRPAGASAALSQFTSAVERQDGGGVKIDLHEAAVAARELRTASRRGVSTVEAPKAPPAAVGTPVSTIGGIELRGLDLNSIQEGTFKMTMPMREGVFKMPTAYEDAEIKVPAGTKAEVEVRVEKGADGKPHIVDAKIHFNHDLTVLNPKASLQPTGGTFGEIADTVQDWLGDITLKGLKIDKNGEIKVDGKVDKPWPLSDSPLQKELGPGTFPRLNTDVQSVVSGKAIAQEAAPAKIPGKSVGLDEMLRGMGAMTKLGNYQIDLKSGPSRLQADGKGIHLSTDEAPVKVHVEGKFAIERDGAIALEIDKNALPEVMSGAGNLDVEGKMRLTTDKKGTVSGQGDVSFRGNIDGVTGKVSPADNVTIPIEIRGANNVVAGKTSISLNGDQVQLKNGSATVNVNTKVADGTRIDIAGTGVALRDGKVITDAGMNFDYDGKAVNVTDGTVKTKITASDADMMYNGIKVRVDGNTEIKLEGKQIALNSSTMSPSANGKISMSASPKPESLKNNPGLPPLHAEADFKLNSDGTLALKPTKNNVTEFIAPFTQIRGNPQNLVDPKGPPAGPVGSQAMKDRITQLTGSKVTTENKAELLIDGVTSQAKRLELIKNAKDSICLQTLIFQDDKSGMDTANALAEAAKRGVKVRVIVDSLGNTESVKDLTEGKQVYDIMKKAGVELQLYNDPKETGLKDLIDEIKRNPKLADIKSLDDLSKPEIATPIFQRLAQLAQGKMEGASPDTRAKLTSALGKMLNAAPGESPTVSVNEIARLAAGDTIRMSQLLEATKHVADLNHRWHEKYLIVDGKQAVMGGMNIADEYLMGGSGKKVDVLGKEKTAWRDTDMGIEGPAAAEAYKSFSKNWKTVTGKEMPPPPSGDALKIDSSKGGGTELQILQHRPRNDGDHNIENFMVENIKALKPGEKCYIGNAYFLPTGALEGYKQALMDAAKRGVDVRVVTNSPTTNDMPQMNQAAIPVYREMLASGVRIFERTGDRTMHQKVAMFGGNTVAVGSWNADNRSASLNSEALAVAYSDKMGKQAEDMLIKDMDQSVAKEVKLADLKALPAEQELRNTAVSIFSDLM